MTDALAPDRFAATPVTRAAGSLAWEQAMSGIKIVAALVRCSADLLLCNDIDTSALHFADVAECTSRLPALIEELQRGGTKGTVVMGRCRFQLDQAPVQPEKSRKASGAL